MADLRRMLTEKRGIILPLGVAVLANVLLFVVVLFPLSRQVANAHDEARVQQEQLRTAKEDFERAKRTVSGKDQAGKALQKFYADVLPASASIARGLTFTRLSQLAQASNVKLEHGTNVVSHEKGSSLSKLTTSYTLTGEYPDVRRFIYSLETTPEFIVLENVALTSAAGQQERGLAMTLNIATYFRGGETGE